MESRGIKNYPKRFQSAEGCYSHRAASHPGIRIKMAHKQFVGLTVPSRTLALAPTLALTLALTLTLARRDPSPERGRPRVG